MIFHSGWSFDTFYLSMQGCSKCPENNKDNIKLKSSFRAWHILEHAWLDVIKLFDFSEVRSSDNENKPFNTVFRAHMKILGIC